MAVIIDDMEVIVEPVQESEAGTANEAEQKSSAATLAPRDIIDITRQHDQRCERVEAH